MKTKLPYILAIIFTLIAILTSHFLKCPYYINISLLSFCIFFIAKERGAFPQLSFTLLALLNLFVYLADVKLESFDCYEVSSVIISLVVLNIGGIIIFWFMNNKLDKVEDEPYQEILEKFKNEQAELIKEKSKVNEKLKEYKLEYSQKLAVLRKFVESVYKNDEKIEKEMISIFKNVLKLESFIFFKFSKEKNSFLKVYHQEVDLNDVKNSKFLKWVIEHAVDFPPSVKILSKDSMKTNPAFSNVLKDKHPIPILFIPIKNQSRLHGFVMVYDMGDVADNEYRAFAALLSEILSMMASKDII
ncbi:MAG: hypothetical protein C0601_13170 [Candidatus Muiribacterium halophilum]|uniref:Uncharacterized protein n=1 Tax=Muiribacterium halophilum TaxID=2053465 RepID=A0A2N5Z9I6_MUIH1|nr:MAG: hypothetical protein C0601_13170 [Candidatus Muirbacterium halophilum]